MKKISMYLLTGTLIVATSSAFAALNYPDINVKGAVSVKAIDVTNLDDFKDGTGTDINTIQSKLTLDLNSELAENVALSAMLEKSSPRQYGSNEDSVNTLQDILIKRANLKMEKIADRVDLIVGRQELGKRFNSLVDYKYAADGIVAKTAIGPVELMLARVKEAATNKDNLTILEASGKVMDVSLTGAIYKAEEADQVISIAGAGALPVANLDYAVEYAKQSNNKSGTAEKDANAMLVKLGSKCDTPMGECKMGLTYLNTSGSKATPTKDENYTGIAPSMKATEVASDILAGNMVNDDDASYAPGISNLNAIIVNASLAVSDALSVGLAYGMYNRNEVASTAKDDIGSEINLSANYKQSDNIGLSLLLAQFSPGENLAKDGDAVTKIQAGIKILFGGEEE